MPSARDTLEQLPKSIFEIRPGTQIVVTLSGYEERIRTAFVGHERGRYFLMRLPGAAGSGLPGLYDYLYQGNAATVSFLHNGNIWGFPTRIQSYTLSPYPLLFTDFPSRLDAHRLRKEDRIECFFPVRTVAGRTHMPSILMDISQSGCRVTCEQSDTLAGLRVGDALELECAIFGAKDEDRLACQIRGIQPAGARFTLGLAFTGVSEAVGRSIESYVSTVSSLLEGPGATAG